jgi:pimeloyl-ACP methyl ester carboxylesterase
MQSSKNLYSNQIILLHGIAQSAKNMHALAKYLQSHGFAVLNIDYPSTVYDLIKLSEIVQRCIIAKADPLATWHFVGHSMGGLLIRILIERYRYVNLGKVVQLAPPNNGSEIADLLQNFFLYQKIYGPAGQQLTTKQNIVANNYIASYPLGIIAGNIAIDPIGWSILPKPNDGRVTVASTKLECMADHLVLPIAHTFFPFAKTAQYQTLYFLQNSKFDKSLSD